MRKLFFISIALVLDAALGCMLLGFLIPNRNILSSTGTTIIGALLLTMLTVTGLALWRAFSK